MRVWNDCWFKNNCSYECKSSCNIYNEFKYLLANSGIPDGYQEPKKLYPEKIDLPAFRTLKAIKEDVEAFVNQGRFLYLHSANCGNGKTANVCKIALTYLALIANGNGFELDNGVYFAYMPELVLLTTDFQNEGRKEILEALMKRKLVIMDDIGSCDSGKFANTNLASIIDSRYRNRLATIFTSNLNANGLENQYGARLADRLLSDMVIELKGNSRRESTNEYHRITSNK